VRLRLRCDRETLSRRTAPIAPWWQRNRRMPGRRHIVRGQRALAPVRRRLAGLLARRRLLAYAAEKVEYRACAGFRLVAKRNRDLAAGLAGVRLPLAEPPPRGDCGA